MEENLVSKLMSCRALLGAVIVTAESSDLVESVKSLGRLTCCSAWVCCYDYVVSLWVGRFEGTTLCCKNCSYKRWQSKMVGASEDRVGEGSFEEEICEASMAWEMRMRNPLYRYKHLISSTGPTTVSDPAIQKDTLEDTNRFVLWNSNR